MASRTPIRVAVTGAAGNIGYALLFRIASGAMFGPDQPVILQLLEVPVEGPQKALKGVAMELEDCAFPLLAGLVLTGEADIAFKDANWCLLVGSKPRGPGMERADLLKDNGKIFIAQGKAIDAVAADDARVAVVGNPCNTNVMIAAAQARRLTADRFTAMVRLDENRARAQLAQKAGVAIDAVTDLYIYGNHSPTMFADFTHAKIGGADAAGVIGDEAWLKTDFLPVSSPNRSRLRGCFARERPGRWLCSDLSVLAHARSRLRSGWGHRSSARRRFRRHARGDQSASARAGSNCNGEGSHRKRCLRTQSGRPFREGARQTPCRRLRSVGGGWERR